MNLCLNDFMDKFDIAYSNCVQFQTIFLVPFSWCVGSTTDQLPCKNCCFLRIGESPTRFSLRFMDHKIQVNEKTPGISGG